MGESPEKAVRAAHKALDDLQQQRSQKHKILTERAMKEAWRIAFEEQSFGITKAAGTGVPMNSPSSKQSSKEITEKEWNERVHYLRRCSNESHPTKKAAEAFRSSNRNGYRWMKCMYVTTNEHGQHTLWSVHAPPKPNRIIVHQSQVFDILYERHVCDSGHKKSAQMWNSVKEHYYNITEKTVKQFCAGCPICALERPKIRPLVGARKPIESYQFRDRYQCDLIDYRADPCHLDPDDLQSPKCQWLLVLKDHFSRLVYLKPITQKRPRCVARELDHILSFIGFPIIFHSDNGKEFQTEVIACLKKLNPGCFCVTGRCRQPNEQGSVERSNRDIKPIIAKVVQQKRDLCQTDAERKKINWCTEYTVAMRAMNSHHSHGTGNVTPYEMVFSQSFLSPIVSQLEHLQQVGDKRPETVDKLITFLTEEYRTKLLALANIGQGSVFDEDPESFIPNFDLDESRLLSESATASLQKMSPTAKGDHVPPHPKYPEMDHQKPPATKGDNTPTKDDVEFGEQKPAAIQGQTKPKAMQCHSAMEEENPAIHSPVSSVAAAPSFISPVDFASLDSAGFSPNLNKAFGDGVTDGTSRKLLSSLDKVAGKVKEEPPPSKNKPKTVAEAFANLEGAQSVVASFLCSQCSSHCAGPFLPVPVYSHDYLIKLQTTNTWFESEFCLAFLTLLAHECHCPNVVLLRELYVHKDIVQNDVRVLPASTKSCLQIVNSGSHFALLEYDLIGKNIRVFDGLDFPLSKWRDGAMCGLLQYGLTKIGSDPRKTIDSSFTDHTPLSHRRVNIPWRFVKGDRVIPQKDGSSCGPIACYHAMMSYRTAMGEEAPILPSTDGASIRNYIIDEYQRLVKDHNNHLRVYRRTDFVDMVSNEYSDPVVVDLASQSETPADNAEDDQCVICLEDTATTGQTRLHCGHLCHLECLCYWSRQSLTCPYCRAALSSDMCEKICAWNIGVSEEARKNASKILTPASAPASASITDMREASTVARKRQKMMNECQNRERNKRQSISMKRRHVASIDVEVGDYVTLRVEKAQRSRGTDIHLPTIVADVSKNGSVKLVSGYGVLTENGSDSYFQADRWSKNSVASPTPKLVQIQTELRNGTFKLGEQMRITVSGAHKAMIPTKIHGQNRCGCKTQCTSHACICRRNGTLCYSGCGCGGSCQHSKDLAEKALLNTDDSDD